MGKSAIIEKPYEPFGPEWEREMMKWSKRDLIAELRGLLMERRAPHDRRME